MLNSTRKSGVLALIGGACISHAAAAQPAETGGSFEIYSGTISGFPTGPEPKATVLLDQKSGRSWMLGVVGGKLQWMAIPFGTPVPPNTIPSDPNSN